MPSHGEFLIELKDAARSFGAVQALRGVDLALARGECHLSDESYRRERGTR